MLNADTSGIRDEDGLARPGWTFQWVRVVSAAVETDIPGATSAGYVPAADDEGDTLKVRVGFTDDGGAAYTPTSPETAKVGPAPADTAPAFTSAAAFRVAENTIAAATVTAADSDPLDRGSPPTFSLAGGPDGRLFSIDGATGALAFQAAPNFEMPLDGASHDGATGVAGDNVYQVTVRAASGAGARRRTADQAVEVTVTDVDEDPTGLPAVSGAARVGQALTAETAGIADPDGLGSPGWTFQWVRVAEGGAETDVADATSGAYTLTAADAGGTVKVKVGFTDDGGNAETLTSAETAKVVAASALAAPDATAEPNDAKVTLRWAAVEGATKYEYRMKTAAGGGAFGAWTSAGGGSATSKEVTGLDNGTAYVFEMRAGTATDWSAPSAPARATPQGPPGRPEVFFAAPLDGDIYVSVVAVADATGYEYRLKGTADGPWTAVSHTYDASYDTDDFRLTGLGAGTWRFEVRAKTGGVPGPASAVQTVTLTGTDSPTGQSEPEPVGFRDCDTGAPRSGRLRLPPAAGRAHVGHICYGPAGTAPTSFDLGEFPPEHQWAAGRRADAGHFSAGTPSTVTVGGVDLYRRAISFNAAGGPDGGGSDGDYIWIFEAQVSRDGETDVTEVYIRDNRSPHPAGAEPPQGTPVPALPAAGALMLGLMLALAGGRRVSRSRRG